MSNDTGLSNLTNQVIGDQTLERQGSRIPQYMIHHELFYETVFFGFRQCKVKDEKKTIYIGKPQNRDGHVLVVGGVGSGKSSCIAIPTLWSWTGTFLAIDIKGELYQKSVGLAKLRHPVKLFDFSKDREENLKCSRYDPFYFLRESSKDDLVQNAREIAQAIIPVPPNAHDPFWSQAAQNVLTAVILYVCGLEEVDPDTGELLQGTFNRAMNLIQSKPIWDLIEEIGKSGNEVATMHINQFLNIKYPEDNKMLAGISAELSNRVMLFATDNRIKAAFTPEDDMLRWEDLETHNIYMRIPEDKLGQWDGAITLMLTQLIRTLERRPDRYSEDGKLKKLPPVLLLLDEFPRLGKMDVIQNAVSTLRSKGVTICLLVQSLTQLDKIYGKETRQIIVDNCQYKAILNVTDPENQRIFSDIIGSINVRRQGINIGGSLSQGANQGISYNETYNSYTYSEGESEGESNSISGNISVVREPIIFPHELATLKDVLLMTPEGFCRVNKLPYYEAQRIVSKKQVK